MKFLNQIKFHTPESIELEFTLAGIGNRTFAYLIDTLIWSIVLLIFLTVWAFLSLIIRTTFGEVDEIELWLLAIQILVYFIIYVGYFVFFETWWQGQTPGKRFVHIRVIQDDGKPARLPQATLRSLLRPVDDLLFIGFFLIVLGRQEKRLGDWLAGTLVIQEERPEYRGKFQFSETVQQFAQKLSQESQISRLLPEDFAVIREYLLRRSAMIPEARNQKSKQIGYQVKKIIRFDEIPEGLTANQFLEAVYLAYQDYHEHHYDDAE